MAIKLQRNFELRIETDVPGVFEVIKYPMTINFSIQRDNLMSVNSGSFQVHNLNLSSRSKIRRDDWNLTYNKSLVFKAGYGDAISICFDGKVQQAYSVREGVNFVTTIDAFDNALQNTSARFKKEYKKTPDPETTPSYQDIVNDVIAQLIPQGIFPGAISNRYYDPTQGIDTYLSAIKIKKDYSFDGNACSILRTLLPGSVFIDMGRLNILNKDEYARSAIKIINSDTGLLGTPRQANNQVYVDILFEPGMVCGQKVTLQSTESPLSDNNQVTPMPIQGASRPSGKNFAFNGDYFVMGIKHSGIISGAVSGELKTSLTLVKFVVSPKEVVSETKGV